MDRRFRSSEGIGSEQDWIHVTRILNDLADECRNYFSALKLKNYIKSDPEAQSNSIWHYAYHEMSIFAISNFYSILNLLSSNSFVKQFDEGFLSTKIAREELKRNFPDARHLRDAIAHPEIYSRRAAKTIAKQTIQLDDNLPVNLGPGVLRRIAINDYYICSFEGRVLKQQLSDQSADQLEIIMKNLVEPFLEPI